MLGLIERDRGWYRQIATANNSKPEQEKTKGGDVKKPAQAKTDRSDVQLATLNRRLQQLQRDGQNQKEIERVKRRIQAVESQAKRTERTSNESIHDKQPKSQSNPVDQVVTEVYLRTVSRYPTDAEKAMAEKYIRESDDQASGIKDLLWAMLNTKEFIVNH